MNNVAGIKDRVRGIRKFLPPRLAALTLRGKNRRRFFRFSCDFPIELHVDLPGELCIINGVARNLSAGGMLIKCSSVPASQTPCHVAFTVPDWFPGGHQNREVMAYAHVRHTDQSRHLFGVSFSNPL